MSIFIDADHRGYKLKEELKPWLTELGHEIVDLGAKNYDPDDDYVGFAVAVARKVTDAAWDCRRPK